MPEIDADKLREHLVDRYGTALFSGWPAALLDLTDVEQADEAELLRIAQREGIDLRKFQPERFGS